MYKRRTFIKGNISEKRTLAPPLGGWGAVLLILLLLPSCIDTLDVDQDGVKPKIVLNGIIEADSAISITISRTYPFTNNYYDNEWYRKQTGKNENPPNFLPNANPVLYVNDELKGALQFVRNDASMSDNGSVFQSSFRPKVGDKIRIEVSNTGYESVWAETIIPQPILINHVDTSTYYYENEYGYPDSYTVPKDAKSMNLALGIGIENPDKDKPGCYSIEIYQEWKVYNYYSYQTYNDIWWQTDSIIGSYNMRRNLYLNRDKEPLLSNKVEDELLRFFLEKGNPRDRFYFTDKNFTDKQYKINTSVWGYYFHSQYYPEYQSKPEMHSNPITIGIRSMSPEMYQAFFHDDSEMEYYIKLLSEPKITFSNVHNGVGILGSFTTTKKVIEIPKYTGEW